MPKFILIFSLVNVIVAVKMQKQHIQLVRFKVLNLLIYIINIILYYVILFFQEGQFECTDCAYYFTTDTALSRHRIVIHGEGETFNCSKCDIRCPDKKTLKYHLRTHNPS